MGDQVRRILGKEGSQTCIYRSIAVSYTHLDFDKVGVAKEWNATDGTLQPINATIVNNRTRLTFKLEAWESKLISVSYTHLKNLSVSPPKKSITRLLSVYGKRTERR